MAWVQGQFEWYTSEPRVRTLNKEVGSQLQTRRGQTIKSSRILTPGSEKRHRRPAIVSLDLRHEYREQEPLSPLSAKPKREYTRHRDGAMGSHSNADRLVSTITDQRG